MGTGWSLPKKGGASRRQQGRAVATPQADVWRGKLDSGNMVSVGSVGEGPVAGVLATIIPVLFLQPHHSVFPFMTLVHAEPPAAVALSEPMVSAVPEILCTGPSRVVPF